MEENKEQEEKSQGYRNAMQIAVILGISFILWAGWYYYTCEYFEIKKPEYATVLTVVVSFNYFTRSRKP